MGIQIANRTCHDIVVISFGYLPIPAPSLTYSQTQVLRASDDVYCSTFTSVGVVYVLEPPNHASADDFAAWMSKVFILYNTVRLTWGQMKGSILDFLDVAGFLPESLSDSIVDAAVRLVVDYFLGQVDKTLTSNVVEARLVKAAAGENPIQRHRVAMSRVLIYNTTMLGGLRGFKVRRGDDSEHFSFEEYEI
ncbi:Aste57867_14471 [Aphanomyces stellatus]|uniref:Aste57867_14471 protein n=1 Tax=Aphanomyces stellatus TaxID=120398 RepID=A0A485L0Q1_9STRA|nr:hypothetical protein As57867_014417 [Aphanomyces stellatus]VFT91293.1 Aste57867_14471 [Aphanomyces stellatus]